MNNLVVALAKAGRGRGGGPPRRELGRRETGRHRAAVHARPGAVGTGRRGRDADDAPGDRQEARSRARPLQPGAPAEARRSRRRGHHLGASRRGHRRPRRSPPRARQPLLPAGGLRPGRGIARGRDRRGSPLGRMPGSSLARCGKPAAICAGPPTRCARRSRSGPGRGPRTRRWPPSSSSRRRRRGQPARLRRGRATPDRGPARADRRRDDGGRREPARRRRRRRRARTICRRGRGRRHLRPGVTTTSAVRCIGSVGSTMRERRSAGRSSSIPASSPPLDFLVAATFTGATNTGHWCFAVALVDSPRGRYNLRAFRSRRMSSRAACGPARSGPRPRSLQAAGGRRC